MRMAKRFAVIAALGAGAWGVVFFALIPVSVLSRMVRRALKHSARP